MPARHRGGDTAAHEFVNGRFGLRGVAAHARSGPRAYWLTRVLAHAIGTDTGPGPGPGLGRVCISPKLRRGGTTDHEAQATACLPGLRVNRPPGRHRPDKALPGRRPNDGGKGLCVQAGPADQRAIDLGLFEKLSDIVRLDAAAV
jgi:hypothetical protein